MFSILQGRLFAHLISNQIFICSGLLQYERFISRIPASLSDPYILGHNCSQALSKNFFFPHLTRFITISWFTSASARTWGKPSASGYFLCICCVSDVQVHSRAAPCRSSSAHSSSHKPTNCHQAAQENKQSSPIWTVWEHVTEYIQRPNDLSRALHLAELSAPESTWRKCCVPCSCCRLQRHALSSWTSQPGLVWCSSAGLHLYPRSQPGF